MVAKFDTGNGAKSCTLHADEIEENGKKLIWSVGDKKFVNDIVGYSDAEIGSDTHTRPIIEINLEFNGSLIPNVKVSPVNRTDKSTPFLANRTLMRRMGLIVNPNKAFVVTEEPEDKYSPGKAKGEAHAGIYFENK
jgi:hypothetical protein